MMLYNALTMLNRQRDRVNAGLCTDCGAGDASRSIRVLLSVTKRVLLL